MSYAASYALYNYYLAEPAKGHGEYTNLRLIRAFEKGLDPTSSEAGFILTHIYMVAHTGTLINGAIDLLSAAEKARTLGQGNSEVLDEARDGLERILEAMKHIEAKMESMWNNSRPKDYLGYRTFIFGITKQPMFPNGVVYEGQYGNKPQFLRGESGANDAIIPLLDHLCQIPMPANPLTEILVEFREYRPEPHRRCLKYIREKSAEVSLRSFLTTSGNLGLVVLYLRLLDHVRSFRWRHWMFTREYILKNTTHPSATGGSPIITWLPNQLSAVMDCMVDVAKGAGLWAVIEEGVWSGGGSGASNLSEGEVKLVKEMMDNVTAQREKLKKEVAKYCQERDSGY
jgi:indoleamine 2,3-dioxygenase